ncbi:MAG: alpha/beta hydrolase, partial [Verrucomicrobiota bacterium]
GRPSESSCERAIDAAWKYLTENQGVRPADILIVGRSVGSGPSVWLADRVEPAGLVLISPFTSTFAVRAPAHLVLPGDRFPNLKRIRGIDHPLLVIHGQDDFLIPPSHGRDLVNASPAALKRFVGVPNAGHNDLGGSDIVAATRKFVREIHSLGAQD